jgi:tetratricopeptide (TPR) repeat protein
LDPEVDALLREVAADPRSILLRVPRKHALPLLFRNESDVGPMTAGLAAIDRHLLAVHRSEVAELLRKVCLMRLLENPRGRVCVSRYPTLGREVKVPRISELRELEESERLSTASCELAANGLDLVLEALRNPIGDLPRVSDLAAVSHRLHPTNEARIFAAMELSQRESSRAAVRLLIAVLSNHPSRETAASAWCNLGYAWNELGERHRALAAYEKGMSVDDDRVLTQMNHLSLGIQVGDGRSVLATSRRLGERIPAGHRALDAFVAGIARARSARRWAPSRTATALVRVLEDELDEAGRRIAHVFA